MNRKHLRYLRGATQALDEMVTGLTAEIAVAHHEITRGPYAILRRVPLLAAPAALVETIQTNITTGVYASIRGFTHLAAGCAITICNGLDSLNNMPVDD